MPEKDPLLKWREEFPIPVGSPAGYGRAPQLLVEHESRR